MTNPEYFKLLSIKREGFPSLIGRVAINPKVYLGALPSVLEGGASDFAFSSSSCVNRNSYEKPGVGEFFPFWNFTCLATLQIPTSF
jgi:hypothetical protein